MTKINGQPIIRAADDEESIPSKGTLERIKRDVERGYRKFCERRGLNPNSERFGDINFRSSNNTKDDQ